MSVYIGIGIIVSFFVSVFALIASIEGFWGALGLFAFTIATSAILILGVYMASGVVSF